MWDLKWVKKAGQVPMGTDKQLMNDGDRPNLEKSNWKYQDETANVVNHSREPKREAGKQNEGGWSLSLRISEPNWKWKKGKIWREKKRGKITVIKQIFKTKFPNWTTMMGWPKMYLELEKVKMD